MRRSMPPASAHLALIPVPAPPPMIGLPAATWARSRLRHSSREKKLMAGSYEGNLAVFISPAAQGMFIIGEDRTEGRRGRSPFFRTMPHQGTFTMMHWLLAL